MGVRIEPEELNRVFGKVGDDYVITSGYDGVVINSRRLVTSPRQSFAKAVDGMISKDRLDLFTNKVERPFIGTASVSANILGKVYDQDVILDPRDSEIRGYLELSDPESKYTFMTASSPSVRILIVISDSNTLKLFQEKKNEVLLILKRLQLPDFLELISKEKFHYILIQKGGPAHA